MIHKNKIGKLAVLWLTVYVMLSLVLALTFNASAADTVSDAWDGTVASQAWDSGSGTKEDPYIIMTAEQLAKLAADVNGGTYYADTYFKLGADLDLAGATYNWTPIGGYHTKDQTSSAANNTFAGTFDGDGKTISNMKSDGGTVNYAYAGYRGLFGNLSGAVKNLTMQSPTVAGRQKYLGAVAAYADGATLENITVNAISIDQGSYQCSHVGGMVGYMKNGTVKSCKIVGGSIVGGLNSNYTGGIVAYAESTDITGCSVKNLSIKASWTYLGGIVSYSQYGDITSCLVENTQLTSTNNSVGGIAGYACGTSSTDRASIKNCGITGGSVQGTSTVGGVTGSIANINMSGCYNIGATVSATSTSTTAYCGGISGSIGYARIFSCFTSASVTAANASNTRVGVIFGYSSSASYGGNVHDSTVCTAKSTSQGTTGFTTEEIKAGAAAYTLSTYASNAAYSYLDWGQKIGTNNYPVWDTTKDASLVVYGIENNDGTMTYYNAGDPNGFEPASDGYYEIASANDWYRFARIAETDAAASARLTADIDFTGVTDFSGYVIKTYSGIFDGQAFTVKNIEASFTKAFAFFTTIEKGGIVQNLKFDDVSLTLTSGSYAVALIAQTNYGRIENISASDITVNAYYASVYARYNYGTISNCDVSGIDLDAQYTSGAIVCTNYNGALIEYCDVTSGTVTLTNSSTSSDVYGGGIAGMVSGTIQYCSNGATVSVTGGRSVAAGGIAGYISATADAPASFIGCSNTGNISTTDINTSNGADYAGGIVGYQPAMYGQGHYNVEECYNAGNVTALANAGGICGARPMGSTNVINNCWNSGTITTTTTSKRNGAAGITGNGGNAIVKNCLNVGQVITGAYGAPIIATSYDSHPGTAKLVNSYAIDGCVVGVSAETTLTGTKYYGYTTTGSAITTGVSTSDLANGEVLALLNAGNTTPVWGQVAGSAHPILLSNNDLVKTAVTIGGVTASDKIYDGTANVGYTGTITTTPEYDVSTITVTYKGFKADGTAYSSTEAPTNAGDYTVTFATPVSDLVYGGKLTLSFKITKAVASEVVTPEAKNALINTTLGDITLAEGWVWEDDTTQLLTTGTAEYVVYYALTDEQISNYDYASIDGFNATEKRIERKVSVTVTLIQITFDSCDDASVPYTSSAITVGGAPMIEDTALIKDTDYTVDVYSVDADGNIEQLLTSEPSAVAKYLVIINVDNTLYGSATHEIVGGEPETVIGESAVTLATTYDCAYILEITPVILSVDYGQTTVGYTSQPIEARPTVKNGNTTLVLGTDYTITYYSVEENGTVTGTLSSAPIDMGKYLCVITLSGVYDVPEYSMEGGVPTITVGTTTLDDLADYACCATLTVSASGSGSVDLSETEAKIAELEKKLAEIEEKYATKEELKTEVDALKKEIEDLKSKDAATAEDISKINQKITSIETTCATKAELQAAVDRLDALLTSDGTGKIADIEAAIQKINDTLKLLDEKNRLDLAEEAITALQAAVEKLNASVSENTSNISANSNAIASLNTTIGEIQTTLSALSKKDEALAGEIGKLNTSLENLSGSLDALSDRVTTAEGAIAELEEAVEALKKADADDTQALTDAIAALNQAITSGNSALSGRISSLRAALNRAISAYQAADAVLREELSIKIDEADATLDAAIKQVQKDLDNAKAELERAIADGDAALDNKIKALGDALVAAEAAYQAADASLKEELTVKIDEAYAALDAAIKQVQKNLDDAKAELSAKDSEIEGELAQLSTILIVVAVIAVIGVCGNIALLVWIILIKRKKSIL